MGAQREHEDEAVVYVAEEEDLDDMYMLTGLFYGHVDHGDEFGEEFEGLTADDAIAWGRARAPIVMIRTGDSGCYFSAGRENPDGLPVWAPPDLWLGRRRPSGFEALDNTEDDPPVLWDVRVAVEGRKLVRVKPFWEAVRRHPAVRDVQAPAPGYQRVSAAFLVEASTIDQARRIANEVHEQACDALPRPVVRMRRASVISGFEVYPHRLGHPVRGPGILH